MHFFNLTRHGLKRFHGVECGSGSCWRPHDRRSFPGRHRALSSFHQPFQQQGPVAGCGKSVGMGILAVRDKSMAVGCHLAGTVAVQIEHAADRHIDSNPLPEPFENLAFDVQQRLGDHGPVQHQTNTIDSARFFAAENGGQFGPKAIDDPIFNESVRDYSLFTEDQIWAGSRVTLHYGLRYDYTSLPQPDMHR